jgi:hypothetical protein
LARRTTCIIRWTAPTLSAKAKLKVELIDSHDNAWLLSAKASNKKGAMKWKVGKWKIKAGAPYANGTDYRIRISTLDGAVSGQSQNIFSIVSISAP